MSDLLKIVDRLCVQFFAAGIDPVAYSNNPAEALLYDAQQALINAKRAALSQPQGEARAVVESEEAWRVSKSGFSIKRGWGDDCRIVTKYAGDTVNLDGAQFSKWLDDAQAICDAYNTALTRPTQEAGDRVLALGNMLVDGAVVDYAKQKGCKCGGCYEFQITTASNQFCGDTLDAAIDAAISAARDGITESDK